VPQTTTLTYLVGDHLGSTSLAVDASTGDVVQTRYKPWGEVRFTTANTTLPTRYTFTGQYSYVSDDATDLGNAGFGLMFYNARWYDPTLGRFAQADTIIPTSTQGTQAWDRYAFVNNNPVRYNDPTGHRVDDGCNTEGCSSNQFVLEPQEHISSVSCESGLICSLWKDLEGLFTALKAGDYASVAPQLSVVNLPIVE